MEFIATKPLEDWKIVAGKFLAALSLVAFALLPTTLYIYTVYQLGAPVGNIDTGAVGASYFGLFLLASAYVSLGLFASSLTKNQIVAFLLAVLFCFVFYISFLYLSKLPIFLGKFDDIVQKIGIEYHYVSMSRGLIDSRDIIYFLGFIFFFLLSTQVSLSSRRW
jgi:ABC-2 type transport system permease protein